LRYSDGPGVKALKANACKASTVTQGPDQTDAASTIPAAAAAAQLGTCRLSKRKTPIGIKSITTSAMVSYNLFLAKNITIPRVSIPAEREHTSSDAASQRRRDNVNV